MLIEGLSSKKKREKMKKERKKGEQKLALSFFIVENARQSHTWQWASGHVRSWSEECMWRVLGGWRKLQKIARFSFPLLLKRKKYFTNPSCLPHWQRKTSPRSTALVRRIGLQPIPPHTLVSRTGPVLRHRRRSWLWRSTEGSAIHETGS